MLVSSIWALHRGNLAGPNQSFLYMRLWEISLRVGVDSFRCLWNVIYSQVICTAGMEESFIAMDGSIIWYVLENGTITFTLQARALEVSNGDKWSHQRTLLKIHDLWI